MKFPPTWSKSERIKKLLYDIDVLCQAYKIRPFPSNTAIKLFRESLLKSSLFSARIEGNPLVWEKIKYGDLDNVDKIYKYEVMNITKAIEYVQKSEIKTLSLEFIKKIHEIVMKNTSSDGGCFRSEESAIYNQAGIVVYLSPTPSSILKLLKSLIIYCQTSDDPAPIKAGITHFWFKKIHPFLNGNGRVGRVIIHWILRNSNYNLLRIIPFEEYLDENRDEYYLALSKETQDVTAFAEFFLEALLSQAHKTLDKIDANNESTSYGLLPRREEIRAIIKDHVVVSFDFVSRRFPKIPKRTLHYDLAQLIKQGYIKKLGSTRGALYTLGKDDN